MKLYAAIDLHSNNSVLVIINERDQIVFHKRFKNHLPTILDTLSRYQSELVGIAVESTFNWYWLVDGLMDAGYKVHLVNTAAVEMYDGFKYTDDKDDAYHLAHLLRLGILPEGYIYPKSDRPLRDLLRKRSQLVRYRTAQMLSIENLVSRNTGENMSGNQVRKVSAQDLKTQMPHPNQALAVTSNLAVMRCLDEQIDRLEQAIRKQMRPDKKSRLTQSVKGIGDILSFTIALETGDIGRFPEVGNYASYCRCVDSKRMSNLKKKGKGNRKSGNKYLSWAYMEAAHFAIRYNEKIRRFYEKKRSRKNYFVAMKAVAHKLARACYYVLRDQVPFDVDRAFS